MKKTELKLLQEKTGRMQEMQEEYYSRGSMIEKIKLERRALELMISDLKKEIQGMEYTLSDSSNQ